MYLDIVQTSHSEQLENFTTEFLVRKNAYRTIIEKYKTDIFQVNALEAAKAFNLVAVTHDSRDLIKLNIDKLTNIFFKPLKKTSAYKATGLYLNLHTENVQLLKTVKECRPLLNMFLHSSQSEKTRLVPEIFRILDVLKRHNNHFKTERSTLFPLLEKIMPQYSDYFKIEQLIHNDYNQLLIETEHRLLDNNLNLALLSRLIGKLYFRIHLSIYREELVLFPLSKQFIHEKFLFNRSL